MLRVLRAQLHATHGRKYANIAKRSSIAQTLSTSAPNDPLKADKTLPAFRCLGPLPRSTSLQQEAAGLLHGKLHTHMVAAVHVHVRVTCHM